MEKDSATNKKWKPQHRWIKAVKIDPKAKTIEHEYFVPQSPEEEKKLWDEYNEKMQQTVDLVLSNIKSDSPPLSDKEYKCALRKRKFIEIYSNLPLELRQRIVLVLDKEGPITWNIAFAEVESKTQMGEEILKKLEKLKIISR